MLSILSEYFYDLNIKFLVILFDINN